MDFLKMNVKSTKINSRIERFFLLLIALSPILQHYKGIGVYSGVFALILAFPYVIYRLAKKPVKGHAFAIIAPLLPYFFFQIIDHGTTISEVSHVLFMIVFAVSFSSESVSSKMFIELATKVACVASFLIIIQYICYYILGFHLQVVPTSLLLNNAGQWVKLAQTGRVGITGRTSAFYRPSSFFLEPAHMYLYLFPPLVNLVLKIDLKEDEMKTALLLSAGIVLSTSGMGIATVIGIWMLYFAKKGGKDRRLSLVKLFKSRTLIVLLSIIILFVIIYFRVDFFRQSVERILFSEGRDNAISGRITLANTYVHNMNGWQRIIGIADSYGDDIDFHMSGFNGAMYRYGIIGTILSYLFYAKSMVVLKDEYYWITIIILIISFFSAHTHATFYMLYFIIFLIEGYNQQYRAKQYQRNLILSNITNSEMPQKKKRDTESESVDKDKENGDTEFVDNSVTDSDY